ncbi:unnamed protein product, partial [marine sediment metagenome]
MPKWTIITAIVCITILLGTALLKDINGVLLSGGLVVIAGLAGWVVPSPQ